jgi:hypothetical protein
LAFPDAPRECGFRNTHIPGRGIGANIAEVLEKKEDEGEEEEEEEEEKTEWMYQQYETLRALGREFSKFQGSSENTVL